MPGNFACSFTNFCKEEIAKNQKIVQTYRYLNIFTNFWDDEIAKTQKLVETYRCLNNFTNFWDDELVKEKNLFKYTDICTIFPTFEKIRW